MRVLSLFALATGVSGSLLKRTLLKNAGPGDAYLAGTQIYGAGVDGAVDLDVCQDVNTALKTNPKEPTFKVCGQNIKVSLYLLNGCADYKKVEVGLCDPTKGADACQEVGPGADGAPAGMQHFQSFTVESCGK